MHPSEQPNHAVFVELKSGGKHYSRNQLINLSDQLKKEIERNIKRDPFNKVDLIFYDGKTYEEITIVYQFEEFADASNPSIRDNLLNDFNHYIKSGNLYKASKRMHNIKRLEGNLPNSPALQYLESIITNPILSTINQAIT